MSRARDAVQPQASPCRHCAAACSRRPPQSQVPLRRSPAKSPRYPPAEDAPADRASEAYHAALADTYEDMATNTGRQEYVSRAVEEFKSALNADPNSAELATGLAQLYFRAGRNAEAVSTVKELLKRSPDNIDAHKLLGRIYLRSLGQQDGPGSESTPANQNSNQVLDQAIAEFVKIIALEPNNLENRLLLGQLYTAQADGKPRRNSRPRRRLNRLPKT